MINKFRILDGANYFSSLIFQNYLVFLPDKKYTKFFKRTIQIDSQKSNGMSEVNTENITKSDNNLAPAFADHHVLTYINFNGHCLINNTYFPEKVINI